MIIIEHPITGDELQIAIVDFPQKLCFDEALTFCENLGAGWRLPSIIELESMYKELHKNGKGDFKDETYHSIDFTDKYSPILYHELDFDTKKHKTYILNFNSGTVGERDWNHWVRAVRLLCK
jgi:hypothetical protein